MRLKKDLELLKKEMGIKADQRKEKGLSQGDSSGCDCINIISGVISSSCV